MSEIPEPWKTAMERAGLTDPRNGQASMRRLAEEAGTTASTVSAMIQGRRDTKGDLIERVAVALGMGDQLDEVFAWVGRSRREQSAFVPHPDAQLLTAEERSAINEMIRLLVAGRRTEAPAVVSLEEAIVSVDGPPLAKDALPRGIRPDLVTVSPDGGLTVWEIKMGSDDQGRNRALRIGQVLYLMQAIQNATGRVTRGVVVEVPMDEHDFDPRARHPRARAAMRGERASIEHLRAAAEKFVDGKEQYALAAHEELHTIESEQEHDEIP